MKTSFSFFSIPFILSTGFSAAVVIDIDGRLADSLEESDLEWTVTDPENIEFGDYPDAVDSDGDVVLTVGANGRASNDAWSSGEFDAGEEWNLMASEPQVGSDVEAIENDKFLTITLDSTPLNSVVFDVESIAISLWRNGNGAATHYALAFDGDEDGWEIEDFLTTITPDSGIGGATTLTYEASPIVSATSTSEFRLYYWGENHPRGNTHYYEVSVDYTITGGAGLPRLSDFRHDPSTGDTVVTLKGRPSTPYLLVEAADLDFANPDQSPLPLTSATVGTLEGSQITTDANGDAVVEFNLEAGDAASFIRAEEVAVPNPG